MHPYSYNFSFRLRHSTQDLSSIFDKLSKLPGFIPKRIWKADELRKTPEGQELEGSYTDSYCYFDFFNDPQDSKEKDLSDAIKEVTDKLALEKNILTEFGASGGTSAFFIGWYLVANSGDIFSSELLQQLADLKIGLEFDIYPPDNKENGN